MKRFMYVIIGCFPSLLFCMDHSDQSSHFNTASNRAVASVSSLTNVPSISVSSGASDSEVDQPQKKKSHHRDGPHHTPGLVSQSLPQPLSNSDQGMVVIPAVQLQRLQADAQQRYREESHDRLTAASQMVQIPLDQLQQLQAGSGSRISNPRQINNQGSALSLISSQIPPLNFTQMSHPQYNEMQILAASLNAYGDKKADEAERSKFQRNLSLVANVVQGIIVLMTAAAPVVLGIIQATDDCASSSGGNSTGT